MRKKLILFGASNFGDEIVQLFRDIDAGKGGGEWEVAGFLDDDPTRIGMVRNEVPVLGTRDWIDYEKTQEYLFVCVIGNPKAKAKVVAMLMEKGARFATGVHPSVIMSHTTSIGEGTVIAAGNILTTNIQVGAHVIINLACTVGHSTRIGDYSTINPGVNISGDVILEEGVLLGTNATILEKMTVGKYSVIGAGAVVNRSIEPHVTAVGLPAKVIKRHQ
jgi:sugar O-acyltransferase (sialic acid O-acetyltransferase NeuD family)